MAEMTDDVDFIIMIKHRDVDGISKVLKMYQLFFFFFIYIFIYSIQKFTLQIT